VKALEKNLTIFRKRKGCRREQETQELKGAIKKGSSLLLARSSFLCHNVLEGKENVGIA